MITVTSKRIRVLVVDDSAFARKVIREVLSRDAEIEVVGIARDGLEALEKIGELKPDVVTLDLLMPELDGLGVLRALPSESAPSVVIVSVSGSETELAIEALQNGAVELVTKPTPLPTDRLYELSSDLITKVKAAAIAKTRIIKAPTGGLQSGKLRIHSPLQISHPTTPTRFVAIGTSTGGPQALTYLFKALPAGLPVPLAIALHIPAGYTAPLAARLSQLSAVTVKEAFDGMELISGQAVIAPGGMHLGIRSDHGKLFATVSREPIGSLHFPSIDILFESVAKHVGAGALGVILTGMGDDGTRGSRAIREAGGRILAESATSCVVYGMPRSIIEAGLASDVASLDGIPELLVDHIYRGHSPLPDYLVKYS